MHSWNLAEWIDALGLRRADQPDLIHAVQPVEILGDHSAFSAQILPPMAWMGGERAAVAGAHSAFRLASTAPGGTYIRIVHVSITVGTNLKFRITTTPAVMANLVAISKHEMGNTPTFSSVEIGTFAAQPVVANTVPMIGMSGTATGAFTMTDVAYIPPGSALEWWHPTANTAAIFSVMFEDCPAQLSQR